MNAGRHWLDRFALSRSAIIAAFLWGFAEATLFFIVPDVILTAISCRSFRRSLLALAFALLDALLGGAIMYSLGHTSPDQTRTALTHVPAIAAPLIQRVESQLSQSGLTAVLVGPTIGVPYKIYAVEWGARGGGLAAFLLVSVPARGLRFLFAVLMANGLARLLAPVTHRRPRIEFTILVLFWTAFYTFYFCHFGW